MELHFLGCFLGTGFSKLSAFTTLEPVTLQIGLACQWGQIRDLAQIKLPTPLKNQLQIGVLERVAGR